MLKEISLVNKRKNYGFFSRFLPIQYTAPAITQNTMALIGENGSTAAYPSRLTGVPGAGSNVMTPKIIKTAIPNQ
jgi:hypothetical protein